MEKREEKSGNHKIELRSEEFHEILGAVPSRILRWGITVLAAITIVLLTGSAFFKYPDTVSVVMTLTGTTPAAALVAKASGKLQEVEVMDKKAVKQGEYLAVIENPARTRDVGILKQYISQLNEKIDTLSSLPPKELRLGTMQSLYSSFYTTLFDYHEFQRLRYYMKKIDYMRERIGQYRDYCGNIACQKNTISEQFKLNGIQYRRDSILNAKGLISAEEQETSRNRYLQGRLSVENMNTSLQNTQIQITQMKESLLDTEYQYQDKKNQLETQLKTYISQLLTAIQTWEQDYVLVASIGGRVTFTNYWVENQNVSVGDVIFNIVPEHAGRMIGKAQMHLERSGKVKAGQRVNIRFTNFPDSEYGTVRGVVKNISMVPVKGTQEENYYTVEIELPDGLKTTYNKELPYLPEMQAQADIITDDISVLERFFMPLRKIWTERF